MLLGLFIGATACLLWGTAYIAPSLLPTFSPAEILLGRYFAFGSFAIILFTLRKKETSEVLRSLPNLRVVAMLAFFGYFMYDMLDVVNIRVNGSDSVALLYGTMLLISPVVLNSFSTASLPSREELSRLLLLLTGLVLLEWGRWDGLLEGSWKLGSLFAVIQGGLWIFYTRNLSEFNAATLEGTCNAHAITLRIGMTCFLISLTGWSAFMLFHNDSVVTYAASHPISEWLGFLTVSMLSGIGCGWLATRLWCMASRMVSYQVLTNLLLADVVAGRLYGQLFYGGYFSTIHILGIIIVLCGGALIRKSNRALPELFPNHEF